MFTFRKLKKAVRLLLVLTLVSAVFCFYENVSAPCSGNVSSEAENDSGLGAIRSDISEKYSEAEEKATELIPKSVSDILDFISRLLQGGRLGR